MNIEDFFKHYQHTFSAMTAMATMFSVVLSLWLSSKQHRSKIVASVGRGVIDLEKSEMTIDPPRNNIAKDTVEYVTVNISNVGLTSVSIPYQLFYIKIPFSLIPFSFSKEVAVSDTMDSSHLNHRVVKQKNYPVKNYPVKIEPNHCENFFVMDFESLKKRLDQFGFLRRCFIGFYVFTGDGRKFKATTSGALRRDILIRIKKAKKTVTDKESEASSPGFPPSRG